MQNSSEACVKADQSFGYRLPPPEIIELLDSTPDPAVFWSPDSRWGVFACRASLPDLSVLTRPMIPLAGMRIDPACNASFQTDFYTSLELRNRETGRIAKIQLATATTGEFKAKASNAPGESSEHTIPEQACEIRFVTWSHSNRAFAFSRRTHQGAELWLVRVEEPEKPVLLTDRLNTVLNGLEWMPDGESILCTVVPQDRGPAPERSPFPLTPIIQTADGRQSPARTYQDLLNDPHDEELFEYYGLGQLVILSPSKQPHYIGKPDLYWNASISPSGEYLLTTRLKRPYSYALPAEFFPKSIDVIGVHGERIHLIADIPLSDNIPIEGVRLGPRALRWWPSHPARLVWTEALDGGDPNRKVPFREQLWIQDAPFHDAPTRLLALKGRYTGLVFFRDPDQWMATEYDRDRRWTTTTLHSRAANGIESKIFIDRSVRDRYGDPGRILLEPDERGFPVAKQLERSVVLAGVGATPEGNRPFLDQRNLDSFETNRLWRCANDLSENVVSVQHREGQLMILTRRESPATPPNYFAVDLPNQTSRPLTHFDDRTPQLRRVRKELVHYRRSDGVPLSGTLYLPPDHQPGERLPLLIWAYPLEFNDADTAGQVSANPKEFLRISGSNPLALITQGYAILDDAAMPVIGDPETMNDTFIEQIVNAAHAAIDHLDEKGIIDPNRVAIGGHSYGAFMAVNVLAHSERFRAGIASSGAYNRTLTPFGFQSERRPLWQAKAVYTELSPFMHADRIKTPLLLIHGEKDNKIGRAHV